MPVPKRQNCGKRRNGKKCFQVALLVTQRKFVEADKVLLYQIDSWEAFDRSVCRVARAGRLACRERPMAASGRAVRAGDPSGSARRSGSPGGGSVEVGGSVGRVGRSARLRAVPADGHCPVHCRELSWADWTIKVALLLPADQRTLESLKLQAELVTNSFQPEDVPTTNPAQEARRAEIMALLEYGRGRRENYETAIGWCQRCLAYPV